MSRQKTFISEKIADLLIEQVGHEIYNSHLYLTFASWCKYTGFKNAFKIFMDQYEEEKGHSIKIWEYLQEAGVFVEVPKIDPTDGEKLGIDSDSFDTFKRLFELSMEAEIKTTTSIKKIASAALEEGDHMTYQWISYLLSQQVTEEDEARDRLDVFSHTKDAIMADHYLEEK